MNVFDFETTRLSISVDAKVWLNQNFNQDQKRQATSLLISISGQSYVDTDEEEPQNSFRNPGRRYPSNEPQDSFRNYVRPFEENPRNSFGNHGRRSEEYPQNSFRNHGRYDRHEEDPFGNPGRYDRHEEDPFGNLGRYEVHQALPSSTPSYQHTDYRFEIHLGGELDLNDLINLTTLTITGNENQRQNLTKLKIDKCNKLTSLTINYTTLSSLDITKNTELQFLNCDYNQLGDLDLTKNSKLLSLGCRYNTIAFLDINNTKVTDFNRGNDESVISLHDSTRETELKKEKELVQTQLKRLIEIITSDKSFSLSNLKLETEKIRKENITYQLDKKQKEFNRVQQIVKSKLPEDTQEWINIFLENHREVLKNDSAFARKQLGRVKEILVKKLSNEQIENLIGHQVEIDELENKLNPRINLLV